MRVVLFVTAELVLISSFQRSPTSAHPPLHLRLKAPDENGFILDRVPVRTLKEVWAILEVRSSSTLHPPRSR